MTLLIDILLIASVLLIAWFGWSAGLTRSFFAVLAGFVSILAAEKYPYQTGINYYLIFVICALIFYMAGAFTLRVVRFFYMNLIDKIGGAALSALVWIVVCINVVIPTMTHGTHALDGSARSFYKTISTSMQQNIPFFTDYVPASLENKVIARQSSSENGS
ncbi:MAG: CvpA family protein [Endomicrobia bacterium]|nr:CvpA family protein [Endomicrobiia bacterium]